MIKIMIIAQLCPLGDETKARLLSTMKIWNDGTGTKTIGNYEFKIDRISMGSVKEFKRLQRNVWDLIYLCLKGSKIGKRNDVE